MAGECPINQKASLRKHGLNDRTSWPMIIQKTAKISIHLFILQIHRPQVLKKFKSCALDSLLPNAYGAAKMTACLPQAHWPVDTGIRSLPARINLTPAREITTIAMATLSSIGSADRVSMAMISASHHRAVGISRWLIKGAIIASDSVMLAREEVL